MNKRRFIESSLHNTATRFGYQEVATPTFENAELFLRKSGEGIIEQIYMFRDLYKQPKPLKLFYQGSCFRYERPQKGRFREFWQFGAELIGTDTPEAIAELIAFSYACILNNNLKDFELRIGYLQILKIILDSWNIPTETQAKLMVLIDKGDIDSLQAMLEEAELPDTQVLIFSDLVQDKINADDLDDRCKMLNQQFPMITDKLDRLRSIIKYLQIFGVKDITVDLGIARGLDYYTGVVFEIDVPKLGAEKQVCGGGEYSLDELLNLKDVACSGFAIGFDRIALAYDLEDLQVPEKGLDIYIVPLTPAGLEKGIEISKQLRDAGLNIDLDIKGRNMSKNLKFASSRSVKFVIFIGEDELKNGSALIRTMDSGEQSNVKFNALVDHFGKIINIS
jgi:histidyl-tRNA synthetase